MHLKPRLPVERGPARFLPPILWMGVIAVGSSGLLSGDRTGPWVLAVLGHLAPGAGPGLLESAHIGLRKVGHLVEFGVLAILWYRALVPQAHAIPLAFILATAYAGVDEVHQALVPSRVPAVTDVMVDSLGALLGLALWTEPGSLPRVTMRVAAWGVGCLAGLAVVGVVLESVLGRPAMDVGIAALGLGLVAGGLAWLPRSAAATVPARSPNKTP
jgi:VanZ family protein